MKKSGRHEGDVPVAELCPEVLVQRPVVLSLATCKERRATSQRRTSHVTKNQSRLTENSPRASSSSPRTHDSDGSPIPRPSRSTRFRSGASGTDRRPCCPRSRRSAPRSTVGRRVGRRRTARRRAGRLRPGRASWERRSRSGCSWCLKSETGSLSASKETGDRVRRSGERRARTDWSDLGARSCGTSPSCPLRQV